MNVRERLIAVGVDPADLDAHQDEVLQGAAQKIRAEAASLDAWPRGRYWKGWLAGARESADMILKTDR